MLRARHAVIGRLARRAVDDLEQDAHADQPAVELDVEPRQALGRLIGQQEGGDEGEELAGRRARSRSRGSRYRSMAMAMATAAERLHQRRGAVGHARHLVRLRARPRRRCGRSVRAWSSSSVKALTMRMPCSVSCSVSRIRVPPWNWLRPDGVDAADQLAQDEERRRRDHEAEERHQRVFHDHHGNQPDQRQKVAADRGDQQVDHLRAGGARRSTAARMNSVECRLEKKPMPSLSSLAKTRRWLSATMRLPICDSNTLWP